MVDVFLYPSEDANQADVRLSDPTQTRGITGAGDGLCAAMVSAGVGTAQSMAVRDPRLAGSEFLIVPQHSVHWRPLVEWVARGRITGIGEGQMRRMRSLGRGSVTRDDEDEALAWLGVAADSTWELLGV